MTPSSEHPDLEDLFRYRERNLPEEARQKVEAHLSDCGRCRQEMDRIAFALQGGAVPVEVPPVSDLLASLSRLQTSLSQPEAGGEALKQRVKSELAPYIGTDAADRILQPVTHGGENLLSTIEPFLRRFLGKAATSRVVRRIVDRAIVRT